MNRRTIISIVSAIALLLIGFGIYKAFNTSYVDYKEQNLSDEERKIYEDRIKTDVDALALLKDKNDGEANNQKFNLNMQIGHNYFGLGKYKEARDYYLAASKLNADKDAVWAALFTVNNARGAYSEAEQNIKTATFLYPNNPDYWKWYIDLKRQHLNAQPDELQKIFNEAFFKTNSHPDIMIAYAQFMESQGDLQTALNYWKQAQALKPDDTLIKDEIARLEALLK